MKILRAGLEERINARLDKLRSGKAKAFFLINLDYPSRQKEIDKVSINKHVKKIEEEIPNIRLLLKACRSYTPNIWDKTKFLASYLLMGKALNNLLMIIRLAKMGASYEVVELSRSAVESLDLVFLFLEDKEGLLLKKWFKGKIITNEEARSVHQKILNEEVNKDKTIPIRDVKSDVYGVYSLYTHSSYPALLDLIDVFYEDFDYKKYSGFHYTERYLHLIDNVVINILLALKNNFIRLNDLAKTLETDEVLKRMGHTNMPIITIDELFKPYKTNAK